MKKFFKAAIAVAVLAVIAGAGEARSEGVMGMQVVEFTPDQVNRAGDPRLAGLSAAAGAIGAAAYSGETQAAEERLAALFSGSAARAAVPVYIAQRPAIPAVSRALPVAQLPKAAYKSALADLGDIESGEGGGDEEIKPSKADGEGGSAQDGAAAAAAEAAPGPLWQAMASGMAGILVVISFVALFPAAPLLLALGTAVLLTL